MKSSFQSSRSNSQSKIRKDTGNFGETNFPDAFADINFDDVDEQEEIFYQIQFEMPKFTKQRQNENQIDSSKTNDKNKFDPFRIIMSKSDLDQMILRG